MRIIADENIDKPIVDWLISQGHDVFHVATTWPGASDKQVITLCRELEGVLLTFDRDMGRLLYADPDPHPGVIYLRLTGSAQDLQLRFESAWPQVAALVPSHFVTVQNDRIRYRKLPFST